jgi:hypothetical protein
MLAGRFMIYFGLLFWLLPFGMAWASSECTLLSSVSTWARPLRQITRACLPAGEPAPLQLNGHPSSAV